MNLVLLEELSFSVDSGPGRAGFSLKKVETSEAVARLGKDTWLDVWLQHPLMSKLWQVPFSQVEFICIPKMGTLRGREFVCP